MKCLSTVAGWSSPEARWAHNPKVAGSNPAPAIIFCCAQIAQLVEQKTENLRVVGSIPTLGIIIIRDTSSGGRALDF